MMHQRSTSTPIRPVAPIIEEPITRYQQPLLPGPLSSPSILPFNIGSTIINPKDGSAYQLIQPLGNGSYAVVYMVREKISGKFYALKCLSKANLSDYQLDIQYNEVRVHESLSHPNIVKLDHYFETSNWLFLVLEYCEGQDLYYWLTQNNDGKDPLTSKLLSDRERITIVSQVFMQILDAVGYCHEKGVAHRDLKPENFIVMIKNDSEFKGVQVKLTDFGLATDEEVSSDFDCGSKPYMSYECRNPTLDTYNPRLADIWSLGIILINLIYHRSPWTDPNPEECKSFATFQLDKTDFLMERFPDLPKSIAKFFATRVFCSVEEGRVGIKEWRNWCNKLVERMLEDEIELEDVFDDVSQELTTSISRESSSFAQRQRGHDRHQSWSDVVGEFENELDSSSGHSELSSSKKQDYISVETQIEEQTNKDNIDENQAEIANNSDADSGFEEEDINDNIIDELKEEIRENSNTTKALSVSPPKIIYCKPKPWGDYKPRGHQRENSIESSSTISHMTNNNHWSSYNQRRERLEQRRKEKQEQTLNSLSAYRRRGSLNTDTNDAFTPNRPFDHRRRPQRQDNIYTTPQRRNAPGPRSPRRKRSSQSINELPLISSPPKVSFTPHDSSSTKMIIDSDTSKQRDKTPKKVAKSTKNHLGKMLVGVVMFNRGVKVGGMVNND